MKKRILACLSAGAMVLSLMSTVSASGGGTVVIDEADVIYKNTKVFNVTIPTAAALEFKLDPLGLLSANAGDSLADLEANEGGIIFENAAPIINNSSIPVAVTASIRITGRGFTHLAIPAANSPVNAGNMTSGAGTTANPFVPFDTDLLWGRTEILNAMKANTLTTVSLFASPTLNSVDSSSAAFESSDMAYVLGSADTSLKFVLEAADYVLGANPIDDPLVLVDDSGSGTLLQLGGFANPRADWSGFHQDPEIPRPPVSGSLNAAYGTAALAAAADATIANHKMWIAVGGDVTNLTAISTSNAVALPVSGALSDPTALVAVTTNLPATAPSGFAFSTIGGVQTLVRGSAATADTTATVVYTADGDYNNLNRTVPNYILAPRAINVSALVPALMPNTMVGQIGLTAVFTYAEANATELAAVNAPFGAANLTADGFAGNAGVPVAYGLMGLSINRARVISTEGLAFSGGGGGSSFAYGFTQNTATRRLLGAAAPNAGLVGTAANTTTQVPGASWFDLSLPAAGVVTVSDVTITATEADGVTVRGTTVSPVMGAAGSVIGTNTWVNSRLGEATPQIGFSLANTNGWVVGDILTITITINVDGVAMGTSSIVVTTTAA
jgi:hypothetical protein